MRESVPLSQSSMPHRGPSSTGPDVVRAPAGSRRALILVVTLFVSIAVATLPSNVDASAVPPPLPTITSLTPNEGPTAGGTPVTLTGTHYEPANTQILIVFRTRGTITIPATNVTVNDTGTTATFTTPPAPEDGRAGIFAITPAGRSNAQTFNYIAPPPPPLPTITSLTPNEGPTAGGTPVTLTGTHYEPANTQILIVFRTRGTITIPATNVTVNDTGTTATFTTPPAPEDGRAGIFAITPAGRSNAQTFNYIAPPPPPLPTITSLTPNEGPTAGGTPVTLTGTHYEPANTQILIVFRTRGTITIPATNVTVNDTGTTATFTTPPAPEDGRAGIFAITPAGRSNAQTFNYIAPPPPPLPTITSLTPNEGPTAGGTPVTLTGTHYEPANTQILIVFRTRGTITIPATNVTVNDTGTTATFTTPPAPEDGRAGIFAITPAGRSNAQTFNYIAPPPPPLPTITSLTPNEGPTAGGTPVTLTGTHYEPANTQILIVFRTREHDHHPRHQRHRQRHRHHRHLHHTPRPRRRTRRHLRHHPRRTLQRPNLQLRRAAIRPQGRRRRPERAAPPSPSARSPSSARGASSPRVVAHQHRQHDNGQRRAKRRAACSAAWARTSSTSTVVGRPSATSVRPSPVTTSRARVPGVKATCHGDSTWS